MKFPRIQCLILCLFAILILTSCSDDNTTKPKQVSQPTFSHEAGTYNEIIELEIETSTPDAEIRYTIDGSDPTEISSLYSIPLRIRETTLIKAKAYRDNYRPSLISQVNYVINLPFAPIPTFSPSGGTYNQAQEVTINCELEDAEIRYSIDGTIPSQTSFLYTHPIIISEKTVLKARVFNENYQASPIVETLYEFETLFVANPTFNPPAGTYIEAQNVSITCQTQGAEIRYSLDGSNPTETSLLYTNPISISEDTTLKARAFKENFQASQVVEAVYEFETLMVANPTFNPPAGTYTEAQNVSITCQTQGAEIRYSLDGSNPTETSLLYTNPISISEDTTLKARAFKENYQASQVVEAVYEFETLVVANPTFNPPAGTYTEAQNVSITCQTQGAEIRYSLDGSNPTETSLLYINPISISEDTTLKARAFKENYQASQVVEAVYEFETLVVANPTFNPPAGTYTEAQNVSITCQTQGAEIRYSLDGSNPTETSLLYTNPISISEDTTLKARAFKENFQASQVVVAVYEFETLVVANPTFNPPAGLYTEAQNVSITCQTQGAEIRYSLDGSNPTETSLLYTNPISISEDTTLKARAFKENFQASQVVEAVYEFETLVVANPTFNPPAGTYTEAQNVSILCQTQGAEIRYSLDESEPTESSLLYTGPINISEDATLKARAYKEGYLPSQVMTSYYNIDNGQSGLMIYVPGGTFTMGRTTGTGSTDELPTHEVTLNSFYISKFEVTQAEYEAIIGSNPSSNYGIGDHYPVNNVSWYSALTYCNELSIAEGLTPCYDLETYTCDFTANGYRLPTEAEWEYAARGGANDSGYIYSGSNDLNSVGWNMDNSGNTSHPVGGKAPNILGIYDMTGNVWEICYDRYAAYDSEPQVNPTGPSTGNTNVYRGGSWYNGSYHCRIFKRNSSSLSLASLNVGFRLVRSSIE